MLGKVWGFLKYYHPNIAEGNYNWDYELFSILPKIINSGSRIERNSLLSDWVASLGEVNTIDLTSSPINDADRVKLIPDLDWISDAGNLSDGLIVQLNKIKYAARPDENYYIGMHPGVGNPEFRNESSYENMQYPDAGYRLLSLYRYWNIIQYFFPYKYYEMQDWRNILSEFIPKVLNSKNEIEYKLVMLELIAKVKDTHANIWGNDQALFNYRGSNYSPVEVTFVENKAVVTDYFDESLGKSSGLQKGDIILSINDKNIDDIVREKTPYTPVSNSSSLLRDIAGNLLRTNESSVKIVYKRDDKKNNLILNCYPTDKINIYKKYTLKDTCFKLINENIAYINPGKIKNTYLPEIMPSVLNSKGLILDFRNYPSDFLVFTLSGYLFKEPKEFVKFTKGSIETPGLFIFTDPLSTGKINHDYFKGKIVILINENTQSSGEYHTMAFRKAPGAVVIGSQTAGADGNVSEFYLPGGIRTMISGIGVYYPDGTETQRIGIVPDIVVKPTIKGVKENRDELLEKAIEIIKKK